MDYIQALAHHHLKWLGSSVGIWADTHFLDRSSIRSAALQCLHRIRFGTAIIAMEQEYWFQYLFCTQRSMDDGPGKIQPSDECSFGLKYVLTKPMKFHLYIEKKSCHNPKITITPLHQASTYDWVLAQGPGPVLPGQWKFYVHVESSNTVRARSPLTKSKN